MQSHRFCVTEDDAGIRIDKFLAQRIVETSRSRLSQWIKNGLVTVNGEPTLARYSVKSGDVVLVNEPKPVSAQIMPEKMPLNIVYQDDDLVVVDKPAGLVVHPGAGHESATLLNGLIGHFGALSTIGAPSRPGVVHRIDAGTSGLLVFARKDTSHYRLAEQFSAHTASRVYVALCWDHGLPKSGTIETLYGRAPNHRIKFSSKVSRGKRAVTHWETLGVYGPCRLLKLRLETGRTHQIRVHLADLNNPLVGDPLYGRKRRVEHVPALRQLGHEFGLDRQALHAAVLGFEHPTTGKKMRWNSQLPADLRNLLLSLGCPLAEINAGF